MKTLFFKAFAAPAEGKSPPTFNFEGDSAARVCGFCRTGWWKCKAPDNIATEVARRQPSVFALEPKWNSNFGSMYPAQQFADLTAAAIRNNPVEAQAWLKRLMREGTVTGDEKNNMLSRRILEADAAVQVRASMGRKKKEEESPPPPPETPEGKNPSSTSPADPSVASGTPAAPAAADNPAAKPSPVAALENRVLNTLLAECDPNNPEQWNQGGDRAKLKMPWLEKQFGDDGVDRKHLNAAYVRLPDWPSENGKPLAFTRGNFAEWRKTHPVATLEEVADLGRAAGQ